MCKKYFVIGLGGYGSKLAEELSQKMKKDGSSVFSLAFDTDYNEIQGSNCDYKFDLTSSVDFDTVVKGLQKKQITLFPEFDGIELNYAKCLSMDKGSALWRLKAYVSFINFMSLESNKKRLDSLLDEIAYKKEDCEFYFVGSLAGGTASGLILPITLYFKKYFREQNYRNYKFTYFASCPDVFALSLNGEMKTKAFANAYATLTEINTVNLTANRLDKKHFIIGDDKFPFGILFDGANGEFSGKDYAPFNDIVLFDRMPSVTSIDTFRLTVCTYIYYYFKGLVDLTKNKTFNGVGIYSGFCVSELNYSLQNNLEYISKYLVSKNLSEEFFKNYLEFKGLEVINLVNSSKKEKIPEIESFTRSVVDSVNALYDEKLDNSSLLLGRGEEFEYGDNICSNDWTTKYLEKVKQLFDKLFSQDDDYLDIVNKLEKSFYSRTENNKIKFIQKKNKLKLQEFTDYYNQLFSQLKTFTNKIIENYFNNDKLNNLIYDDEEICLKNVLTDGDDFINPTLALVKLSQLFNKLSERQRIHNVLSEEEINSSLIYKDPPLKLFELEDYSIGKIGYGKKGYLRFIKTFNQVAKPPEVNNEQTEKPKGDKKSKTKVVKNEYVIKYPAKEERFILLDFNLVLYNVKNGVYGIFLSKLLETLSKLIENYSTIYKNAGYVSGKIQDELLDLVSTDALQNGFYEVRSQMAERQADVDTYCNELKKKGYTGIDNLNGKTIFEFAKNLYGDFDKPAVNNLTKALVNNEKERFLQSDLYKELLGKNAFSAMCEPSVEGYSKSILKKACNIEPHLLTENKPEEINKRTLYISKEVAEYVVENSSSLNLRETNLQSAVEELLSSMGDYQTQVQILEGLAINKVFVVAQRSSVSLGALTKVNCEDGSPLYETYYKKAIKNKTDYATEMWNPHIFILDGKTELSKV